jgi:Gnt-I system high-affinity gluconate transporter
MSLLVVLFAIALLLFLIIKKLNPMIALLIASIVTGLLLGMPAAKVVASITNGVGNTLGGVILVLAFGAMMGKLIEDTGASQRIVMVLLKLFGLKNIQWAVLLTGFLVGIPLFYNAGFVVLIPLVFALSSATNLPKLYIGIPMAASLSVTHCFLPPHPGPVALATILKADLGKTLLYGFIIIIPIAIIAGIIFPRLIIKLPSNQIVNPTFTFEDRKKLPSSIKSFAIALLPVLLIATGTITLNIPGLTSAKPLLSFISDPTIALLIAVLFTILIQRLPVAKAMESCVEGVKGIAMIILIIAAGGAFKQVLIDSGIGEDVKTIAAHLQLSPLLFAWIITALLRVTLGSATVAGLTASGLVLPLITNGVSAELMVLSVGAGSVFFSHVNDTGFWMFKEYFNLNLKETFKTWTLMESIISILGLVGVLLLNQFI